MTDKKYYDIDGNEVSLDTLCRKEPAWAANIIRVLKEQARSREATLEAIAGAFDRGRQDAFRELELAQKYPGEGERHVGTSTATQLVFALAKVEKLEARVAELTSEVEKAESLSGLRADYVDGLVRERDQAKRQYEQVLEASAERCAVLEAERDHFKALAESERSVSENDRVLADKVIEELKAQVAELEARWASLQAAHSARLEAAWVANRKLNERLQDALMQLGGEP